ncbi:MAG: DNA topoisomerase III [Burkholderiales bacterium]|nr:DNA topoisomerase III [Burkholderiales bacterium]
MSKNLIIAEKPSVANDIARALGGFTRHGDYFESNAYVLSSAIGHLLELVAPEGVEVKRGKWSFVNLPVIPPHFDVRPIERTEDRLKLLLKLLKRKDVTGVINACDAGREGELIFRYIMQHAGNKKPIQRLWLQSMTQGAIRDGFERLRTDKSMLPLADAAVCRSESDWLVGINGTRAMTAFNSKEGGFYKTTVGRVQTPTLAILVEREDRIRKFQSRDYWEVHASFAAAAGSYSGRWFDEKFAKAAKEEDAEAKPERIWDAAQAEALRAKSEGKPGIATEEAKPTSQISPLLFDLTSLQREANGRFGFSARATLSLAQALYERHKVLTYPRTDARALPEDYLPTVKDTMAMLAGKARGKDKGEGVAAYAPFAREVLKEGWVKPSKRIFDNTKISDHFAIIPTLQAPGHLSDAEAKLYDMVVKRFLAVFFPAAEFLVTTRITRVEGEPFRSEGRVMVKPGWLAIYGRDTEKDDALMVAIAEGEKVTTTEVEIKPNQTRPPARFSEATLLSAMEGAGKLVEDEELRAAMSAKGLGTPATRAAVIEGLIFEDYVHRNGRELVPTPKAFSLMFALRHFGITELTSPELTGNWEFKLKQMERGELDRAEFMDHIVEVTRELVSAIKKGDIPDTAFLTLKAPCPKCGGTVQENYRKFQCQACDFAIWKVVSSREFAPEEIEELIAKNNIGPLQGFRSRMGKPFAAVVRLSPEFKAEFDFGQSNDGSDEVPDFSGLEALGPCPKCAARVFEQPMSYVCEKSLGPEKSCDFRSGRIILQRPIEREQMQKLLATGRTELLHRFISKKGRPFSAFLVRGADGKVGFEFAPRAAKPGKAAAGPAEAKAGAAEPGAKVAVKMEKPAAKRAKPVAKTAPTSKTAVKATKARKHAAG